MMPPAPFAPVTLDDAPGRFGKRRHALDTPLLRQRVAARPRQPVVGAVQIAGLGEQDERHGPESQLAPSFANDEPLVPPPGTRVPSGLT